MDTPAGFTIYATRKLLDRVKQPTIDPIEPTTELVGIPGLGERGFDVVRSPTADPQQSRWHFVTSTASALALVSFPTDDNGRVLVEPSAALNIQPTVLLADGTTPALTLTYGISAVLFAERETTADSPSLARGVRLMVAAPVACAAAQGAKGFAVLGDIQGFSQCASHQARSTYTV